MTLYKASWHTQTNGGGRKHCYVIADNLADATSTAIHWGDSEPNETLRLTAPLLNSCIVCQDCGAFVKP